MYLEKCQYWQIFNKKKKSLGEWGLIKHWFWEDQLILTGFQIGYKHTRQTKCKPALLNVHQKSFHIPRSHNRDIMLGHRKSWQNSAGSYERLGFKKWGWLGEPEVRGLYIYMDMPAVSTVDTQGGGFNWFQFPVGSLPLSHSLSFSLPYSYTCIILKNK